MRCDGECVVVVIVGESKVRGEETQKKRMLEARLLCTSMEVAQEAVSGSR